MHLEGDIFGHMSMLRLMMPFFGILPGLLIAFSAGPPVKSTGAAVDGGLNCTVCHRTFGTANPDSLGSVVISAASYTLSVKQIIKVTVTHPEAARWGFQLTARLVSDETKPAGTFTGDDIVKVLCDDGTAAPCASASQTQFAEHSNAPRTATGAGFTFNVTWTPPATDAGDVIFYAAGNAADGNGAPTNDRIYTTALRISGPCSLMQKPSIAAALNGASFLPAWNSGSMMSLFGANFAAAGRTRAVTAADIVGQKFPQALGCIAVSVNGQSAPLAYVQGDQINFQAPTLTNAASASVVVIANPGGPNELRSDPFVVTTQQAFAPALFTFNGKSVAATNAAGTAIIGDGTIPTSVPAKPGDIVVMYATGLGNTTPAFSPGDIANTAARLAAAVSVSVGGIQVPDAEVLYAGASPQSICGLQQINVRLPAALPDGNVPLTLSMRGTQSQPGITIAIKK
jgi:uncharacterized protein (TIGR03437 family)